MRRALVVVLALLASCCAALTGPRDGRPGLLVPRVCPDGAPLKFHQHPACGRWCGYSCLPDRWKE